MTWLNAIVYAVINVVILGTISFLLKGLIQKSLDKEIEKFKSDLQKSAIEHQIRFARFHDDRAEIIKNVFTKLVIMQRSLKSFMNIVQFGRDQQDVITKHKEKGCVAEHATNDFIHYYAENEVLLSDDICQKVNELIGKIREAWITYDVWVENAAQSSPTGRPDTKKWLNAFTIIDKDVPEIKKQLKEKMRQILGVIVMDKTP